MVNEAGRYIGNRRRLYPQLTVVTEDMDRDCYLVTPSRATASKSFEMLAAFNKAGGEWMPGRMAARWVVPNARRARALYPVLP